MLERATRECRMSPQIATVSPCIRPLRRRIVSASSSAWVGCSCAPSPALTTEQVTFCDRRLAAPDACVPHDQQVRPHGVERHRRVDQRLALLHRRRADRACSSRRRRAALAASSNDDCVRVEASKNRLICVRPRSVARLLVGLPAELDRCIGPVEQIDDVLFRKVADAEQMAVGKEDGEGC